MKKKSLILIFAALITMSLTGCGSSSSSNPVSSGSMNSGLVSVSGNVKNLEGNGTVSFYTPTAVFVNNSAANSSFRTSVANNEVYTFNTDEAGNYSGQIPAGDYYIIAQNSDGSMKAATTKQNLRLITAAENDETSSTSNTATINFDLVPTINIIGVVESEFTLTQSPVVYIEDMPFADLEPQFNTNNFGGYYLFTLKNVPLADSYTICSNFWIDNTRYHCVYKTISSQIESAKTSKEIKEITLSSFEPISISGKNIKMQLVRSDDSPFSDGTAFAFLTRDINVFPAKSDANGYIYIPVDSLDEITCLYIDRSIIKKSDIKPDDEGNIKIQIINEE